MRARSPPQWRAAATVHIRVCDLQAPEENTPRIKTKGHQQLQRHFPKVLAATKAYQSVSGSFQNGLHRMHQFSRVAKIVLSPVSTNSIHRAPNPAPPKASPDDRPRGSPWRLAGLKASRQRQAGRGSDAGKFKASLC